MFMTILSILSNVFRLLITMRFLPNLVTKMVIDSLCSVNSLFINTMQLLFINFWRLTTSETLKLQTTQEYQHHTEPSVLKE